MGRSIYSRISSREKAHSFDLLGGTPCSRIVARSARGRGPDFSFSSDGMLLSYAYQEGGA